MKEENAFLSLSSRKQRRRKQAMSIEESDTYSGVSKAKVEVKDEERMAMKASALSVS
jgi:hypothetical protein